MADSDPRDRSLRPLLEPRSVALIGASRRRGTVGGELFANLIASGFDGPVYPVNPTCDVVPLPGQPQSNKPTMVDNCNARRRAVPGRRSSGSRLA